MKNRTLKTYLLGCSLAINLVVAISIILSNSIASADEIQKSPLKFPIYFNGTEIALNESFIIDGRSYVQLRELCEKTNVQVDWVDPEHHQSPIPGGNLPGGINLTNPTFVYVSNVTDFYQTNHTISAVEISGIYQKYNSTNPDLTYAFSDEGLIIRTNGTEDVIQLDYNPSMGRMYLEINEFKAKVLPYIVDICLQ